MSIETRQHELFNVDLGEGAPRKALIAGIVLSVTWWGFLALLLGQPSRFTATLFIFPPVMLTIFGWQESANNPRRRKITEWVLALRYLAVGHRPVVALGRQQGPGHERGLMERIAQRFAGGDALALLMPWRVHDESTKERKHAITRAAGRTERVGGRVQLVGTNAAEQLMRSRQDKKGMNR